MTKPFQLFGIPSSLYTGKARSYLRKQAIPFEEQGIWADAYQHQTLPQIGRTIMPVVICPDGTVVKRRQAPRVARWVERMNTAEENFCEYSAIESIDDKHLPDTLIALLRFIAEEYLPELTAHVAFANQWLDDQPDLKTGSNGLDDPAQRFIGMAEFDWRGTRLSTLVMPYRFYLLQFLQQHFDESSDDARRDIESVYAQTGLASVLTLRTRRPVERRNHLEVWGEATQ
ncbi:hypothetical protein [Litorivivens sp.]|uniref:hypothetical protein n=1 Tax=Litorivivens sp. TaxID=2020868 RepID=UPI003563B6B0